MINQSESSVRTTDSQRKNIILTGVWKQSQETEPINDQAVAEISSKSVPLNKNTTIIL